MIIQNRQHVLALIAIAAIALLAADRLVITPLAASWKERTARIQDLKQSVTQGAYLLDRRESCENAGNACAPRPSPPSSPPRKISS
jgi:hypothetical protein